jgi:DNA-binding HxlR family transcriptional regulator
MVRKEIQNLPEPEIFSLECPAQQVLDIICNKWSALVICCLAYGTKRYNQLQKQIEGISQKMLTQTLRNLERHGLVERKVYPAVPPRVEYSLTSLGETLIEPLSSLADWADLHISEIREARDRNEEGVGSRE